MHSLLGKHIVLGLSGGIACYKAAELCRSLIKESATVARRCSVRLWRPN
jgi:phosphopantothenoylcysteine decarboxylase / phosphopantothenate---cysteine ligase